MTKNLTREISDTILKAETVESVFGILDPINEEELKKAVRKLQMLVHPDHNIESDAETVFQALKGLEALANKAISEGIYGENKKIKVTKIESKKDVYEVGPRSWTGANSIVFRGTNKENSPITLKLAKNVASNKAILSTVKILNKHHKQN